MGKAKKDKPEWPCWMCKKKFHETYMHFRMTISGVRVHPICGGCFDDYGKYSNSVGVPEKDKYRFDKGYLEAHPKAK